MPTYQARRAYVIIGALAYGWLIAAVVTGLLPAHTLLVLIAALPNALAANNWDQNGMALT
jgi:uncharacterized membrane protein YbaN (DUF454 family)